MSAHLFLWPLVFEYLDPEDLVCGFSVQFVFQGRKSSLQAFLKCKDLNLADTGSLYLKVPLKIFTGLYRIDLSGTSISSRNFLKLVSTAKQLRVLNIQGCVGISEQVMFEAKPSLRHLRSIDISHNEQFSILVIACLCSLNGLQELCARGFSLDYDQLLFLSKTFPRLRNRLDLETDRADSDYLFDAVDIASDFQVFEDLF